MTPQSRQSRLSSPVAWTIVMLCFMASSTNWFVAVSLGRCCQAGYEHQAVWPYLACAPPAALASSAAARRVQGRDACLPVPVRPYAPGYLVDDCQLVTDVRVRQLRSADTRTLAVNRTYSSFGDRTFAAAGTRVWNSLPPDLRQPGARDCHTAS